MIIYEAHVKGLTMLNPFIEEINKGKFLGVCDDWMIQHYKRMGVDAIQLMPVFNSKDTYWGYDPVSWFELNPKYGTLEEFEQMVQKLHNNGIKLILDVVYNHLHRDYEMEGIKFLTKNYSGCGNNVDVKKTLNTITASIDYWFIDIGVDGMRFDLANILGREGDDVGFNPNAEFFQRISKYKDKIKIAEPYDLEQQSLGQFPEDWLELNHHFRDHVRGGNVYTWGIIPDHKAVNYICCHDGFVLQDLVSYNDKHNWINGEGNRDGCNDNLSYNFGVEGPTNDHAILQRREAHKDWLMRQLKESKGHKLFLAGDEVGNSQYGCNNGYKWDGEFNWVNWPKTQEDFDSKVKYYLA